MAPRTRFRFRKSVPLLGRFLTGTISRRSVSLNLRLGIFSRSWGTRGRTTTLDVPGTSGLFFRKEERRRKPRDPAEREALAELSRRRRWKLVIWLGIILTALTGLARYGLEAIDGCGSWTGLTPLAILIGLEAALIAWLWGKGDAMRGPLIILVLLALGFLQWKAHGMWISPPDVCD